MEILTLGIAEGTGKQQDLYWKAAWSNTHSHIHSHPLIQTQTHTHSLPYILSLTHVFKQTHTGLLTHSHTLSQKHLLHSPQSHKWFLWSHNYKDLWIFYISAYTWILEKWYWWTYLQGQNGDADVENGPWTQQGKGRVGGIRIALCTYSTMCKIGN